MTDEFLWRHPAPNAAPSRVPTGKSITIPAGTLVVSRPTIDVAVFATELRKWWSFDDRQVHSHSWHDRENFIETKLPALLADVPSDQ